MDFEHFLTDKSLETEGVWVNLRGEARIKIARLGNARYKDIFQRLMKPHRKAIRSQSLPDETAEQILCEALAEGILLDWEGFTRHGKSVDYTKEEAKKVLKDLPDFREIVLDYANDMENFRVEEIEDAVGN